MRIQVSRSQDYRNWILLVLSFGVLTWLVPRVHQVSASLDFVQYYAGFQALRAGSNPYDPIVLATFEKALGYHEPLPMMLWVPPWTLTLMSPFLLLGGYEVSLQLWRLCAVALFIFSALLLVEKREGERGWFFYAAVPVVLCGPFLHSLIVGQVTALLVLGAALVVRLFKSQKYYVMGVASVLLTIKPHLFILTALAFLITCQAAQLRRWFLGFILGATLLVGCTEVFFPGATLQWLEVSMNGSTEVVHRGQWLCSTLSCLLRGTVYPKDQIWFSVALLVLALLVWVICKRRWNIPTEEFVIFSLPLSVMVSPYGWYFDFAVLTPVIVLLVNKLMHTPNENGRELYVLSLALFSALSVAVLFFPQIQHADVWWHPLGVLGIASLVLIREDASDLN